MCFSWYELTVPTAHLLPTPRLRASSTSSRLHRGDYGTPGPLASPGRVGARFAPYRSVSILNRDVIEPGCHEEMVIERGVLEFKPVGIRVANGPWSVDPADYPRRKVNTEKRRAQVSVSLAHPRPAIKSKPSPREVLFISDNGERVMLEVYGEINEKNIRAALNAGGHWAENRPIQTVQVDVC